MRKNKNQSSKILQKDSNTYKAIVKILELIIQSEPDQLQKSTCKAVLETIIKTQKLSFTLQLNKQHRQKLRSLQFLLIQIKKNFIKLTEQKIEYKPFKLQTLQQIKFLEQLINLLNQIQLDNIQEGIFTLLQKIKSAYGWSQVFIEDWLRQVQRSYQEEKQVKSLIPLRNTKQFLMQTSSRVTNEASKEQVNIELIQKNNQTLLTEQDIVRDQINNHLLWNDQSEHAFVVQLYKKNPNKFHKFQIVGTILKAQFKQNMCTNKRKQIIKDKQNVLINNQWTILASIKQQFQWMQLFQNMQIAYCRGIQVKIVQLFQQFLPSFIVPKFQKLIQLLLEDTGISNIQSLSFLDANILETLTLCHNQIHSLQPLIKFNFNSLQSLDISENLFQNFNIGRINSTNPIRQLKMNFINYQKIMQFPIAYLQEINFLSKFCRGKQIRKPNFGVQIMISKYHTTDLQNSFSDSEEGYQGQVTNLNSTWIKASQNIINSLQRKFALVTYESNQSLRLI